jgi:hypothetical protein
MKKWLIVLVLSASFANNAQAQTKEETITWLQEKLQKYLYMSYFGSGAENITVEITQCFITIRFTMTDTENRKLVKHYGQYYIIPTDGAQFGHFIEMKNGVKSIRVKEYDNAESLTKTATFRITEGEEKLLERLQKAVDHLATFCPRTKETF